MRRQPRALTPYVIEQATARARRFDNLVITFENEETLLALGDAVGGLSAQGFHADLASAIERATEKLHDDNQGSRNAADARWLSAWMVTATRDVAEEIAGDWLESTQPWAGLAA